MVDSLLKVERKAENLWNSCLLLWKSSHLFVWRGLNIDDIRVIFIWWRCFECSHPWSNSVNYLVNCEACGLELAANTFKNCSNICTLCSNVVICRCKLDRRTLQKHKFSRCKTSRPSLSPDIIEYLMTKFSFLLMGSGKSQVISL